MTNVIDFPVIPRKAADRGGKLYRCYHCKRVYEESETLTHLHGHCCLTVEMEAK